MRYCSTHRNIFENNASKAIYWNVFVNCTSTRSSQWVNDRYEYSNFGKSSYGVPIYIDGFMTNVTVVSAALPMMVFWQMLLGVYFIIGGEWHKTARSYQAKLSTLIFSNPFNWKIHHAQVSEHRFDRSMPSLFYPTRGLNVTRVLNVMDLSNFPHCRDISLFILSRNSIYLERLSSVYLYRRWCSAMDQW